jgi:hypothetical protein
LNSGESGIDYSSFGYLNYYTDLSTSPLTLGAVIPKAKITFKNIMLEESETKQENTDK